MPTLVNIMEKVLAAKPATYAKAVSTFMAEAQGYDAIDLWQAAYAANLSVALGSGVVTLKEVGAALLIEMGAKAFDQLDPEEYMPSYGNTLGEFLEKSKKPLLAAWAWQEGSRLAMPHYTAEIKAELDNLGSIPDLDDMDDDEDWGHTDPIDNDPFGDFEFDEDYEPELDDVPAF